LILVENLLVWLCEAAIKKLITFFREPYEDAQRREWTNLNVRKKKRNKPLVRTFCSNAQRQSNSRPVCPGRRGISIAAWAIEHFVVLKNKGTLDPTVLILPSDDSVHDMRRYLPSRWEAAATRPCAVEAGDARHRQSCKGSTWNEQTRISTGPKQARGRTAGLRAAWSRRLLGAFALEIRPSSCWTSSAFGTMLSPSSYSSSISM